MYFVSISRRNNYRIAALRLGENKSNIANKDLVGGSVGKLHSPLPLKDEQHPQHTPDVLYTRPFT